MSAGDIDDRLGSAAALRYLEETNEKLRDYLRTCDSLPIIRASIPFGAGISKDGGTRYIDQRLDCVVNGVDCSVAVARHESVEWALREFDNIGVHYATDPLGHRLANRAEYQKLQELGVDWEEYDTKLDPQLRRIEREPLGQVPKDLALYPYEEDERMMDRIREAQYADRG